MYNIVSHFHVFSTTGSVSWTCLGNTVELARGKRGGGCLALLMVTLWSVNLLQVILSGVIYEFPESGLNLARFWGCGGRVDNGVCPRCPRIINVFQLPRTEENNNKQNSNDKLIKQNKKVVVRVIVVRTSLVRMSSTFHSASNCIQGDQE